ncbi:MAG: hypothetical protein WBE77_08875, partial [Candidatus Cybelea sp.]
ADTVGAARGLLGGEVGERVAFATGASGSWAMVGAVTTCGVGLCVDFGCRLDVLALAGVALAGALGVGLAGAEDWGVGLADLVGSGVTVGRAVGIGTGL